MWNPLNLIWKLRKLHSPKWNKGICSECGCKWEYFSDSRPEHILYTCAGGHSIERVVPDADPNTTDIQVF